ncbi:MAG: tetratricopeptide repeat protein [Bacteroidales bacterium]|nr:tetratricopeptide repeat protein [Bacteroidales bacterium]
MNLLNRLRIIFLLLVFLLTSAVGVFARKKDKYQNKDKSSYLLLEAQRLEQIQNPDSVVVAFEILKRVVETDNKSQEAHFKLSSYYKALGMPDSYYTSILTAATLDTANYHYNIAAADNAIRIGDYNLALDIYNRLLTNNPNDENLYVMMANAYLEKGDLDKCMACYDKIENLTENIEYVAITKAGIYEHFKKYDKSLTELKRLSESYPNNVEYLQILSMAYLSVDSLQKSRELIEKIKDIQQGCLSLISEIEYYKYKKEEDSLKLAMRQALECPEIVYEVKQDILKEYVLSFVHENNDLELREADEVFSSLTEQYPREVYIKKIYANFLLLEGRYPEAVEQCQSALYIEPNNIDIQRQMIQGFYYSGDYDSMNRVIDNALEQADSSFVIEASSYYYLSKQFDKAIENLKSAAEKYSASPIFLSDIYSYLADIFFNEKEIEKAEEYYELAIKNNSNNLMAMNNYAYCLAENGGDLSFAEQMSAKTIKLKPNDPTYLDTYGWIYFKQGKYLFAELYIKRAIDNGAGESPEVLEHYGDILYHQGKTEAALKYWQKAYQKLPEGQENEKLNNKIESQKYIE